MNVVPQDSTNPQRPNVEGLRSYSSQNSTVSGFPSSNTNPGRDLTRAYNHATEAGRALPANNTEPISNPYAIPHIPSPHYRHSGNAQYTIPQRHQSLGYGSEQAPIDAQRRAMIAMLRQQSGHEEDANSLRRRMSAAAYTPNTSNLSPRYTTSYSAVPNFGRPNFSTPNPYSSRTASHQPAPEALGENRSRNGYSLPRWQPDAEVTNCPICSRMFTWLYRKHHCRKCGRVVCASCSPHKITIPRQYIVNPPGVHPVEVDLTSDSAQDSNTAARLAADQLHLSMEGGQEVRLCNPCVPDPNPLPPSQLYSRSSNSLPVSEPAYVSRTLPEGYVPNRRRSHHMSSTSDNYARYSSNPLTRHRVNHQAQYNPLNLNPTVPYGSAPDSPATHLSRYSQSRPHRHHASLSMLPTSQRRSMFENMTTPELPVEDSPQRQIAEEDECPICHEELPPKGPDGSETERESHVTLCIEAHFSSSRPKDGLSNRPDAVVSEPSATSALAGSNLSNSTLPGPSSRRRTTGMVVYNATEKDCIGEDGTPQECIICFEDFEAGTEMGRLECLCKFHKACIRSWWDTKGTGACPVHQGGLI